MPKIVHLTTGHRADDVRILHKECCWLAQAGYEVVLIAPEWPGEATHRPAGDGGAGVPPAAPARSAGVPPAFSAAGKMPAPQESWAERRPTPQGVRVVTVPAAGGRFGRLWHTTRRICQAALAERADLYHLHDPELLPVVGRLRRSGAMVVFDMHENLPADLLARRWIPPGLRYPAAWAADALQRRWLADLPVVLAEDSYAQAFPWLRQSVVVRNFPLEETLSGMRLPSAEPRDAAPTLAYVGVVDADHGSVAMIESLAILRRFEHAPRLVCVGPIRPRHRRELLQRIARLGLRDVELPGRQPPQEAWRRTAGARVGLALLARRPNLVDSYPTKMFEYMAMGLPIVASDFPLYRSVVQSNGCGVCVDPARPEEIAGALGWLLDNPDLARAMGQRGREAVYDHYHWETEGRRLVRFYGKLLGRAGRPVPAEALPHPELVPFPPGFRADQ